LKKSRELALALELPTPTVLSGRPSKSSETGSSGEEEEAAALRGVHPPPPFGWKLSPWTLKFQNGRVERRFKRWRNRAMLPVDFIAYSITLVMWLFELFAPSTAFELAWKVDLPIVLLPFFNWLPYLLLRSPSWRPWYCQHREQLLLVTWLGCTVWIIATCHYLDWISAETFLNTSYFLGLNYFIGMIFLFEMRFFLQAAVASGACVAYCVLVMPRVRLKYFPEVSAWEFLLSNLPRCIAACLMVPLAFVYWIELRSRRIFLDRHTSSASQ
jgi:hypothetical protein